ncbi:MAG: CCDC90 family protein [Magnetococcus sp. XQGC-1]
MNAVTFDTLKFVETLKASGFDEPQAKGMAVAIQEVQKNNMDEMATKGDLRELRLEIAADMARLHGELATIRWGIALIVGGVVALILKTFFPH